MPENQTTKFNPTYKIYRAKTNGGGVASQFALDVEKKAVWLTMAPQIGEMHGDDDAKFDWTNKKMSVKLGLADIGEMLAVLDGRQKGIGMTGKDGKPKGVFHKNKNGSATINFSVADNGVVYLGIGIKKESEDLRRLYHSVNNSELSILSVLLRQAVLECSGWK